MSQVFVAERVQRTKGDPMLLGVVTLLIGVGLVMLFSASHFRAESMNKTPFFFLANQIGYALAGIICAFIISRLTPELIKKSTALLIVASLILMILTFIPGIGATLLGGRRWIMVAGLSFQPSELVKLALIVYLASILHKKQENLHKPQESLSPLLPPFTIVSIFVVLIFLQNNFSTAGFVLVVSIAIFFMAGVKLRFFVLLALLVIPLGVLGVVAKEHRVERLSVFMDPTKDPSGSGYQVLAAQAALRDGGFLGQGIGLGERKLGKLPEAQSDFIFAVVGEEMGYAGVLGVLTLFGLFAWRGYRIAARSTTLFDRLLAFGVTTSICLQALINIAVTAGVLPPTGVPLPFFSAGGSSLFLTLCMVGVVFNVARRMDSEQKEPNYG